MIFLELFLVFLKVGAFTFGGGYAMLPLIKEEVLSRSWLTETEIVDFIAVSESTPGPFAVNIATYVGNSVGGVLGAILASLGVVLPSFLIILIVARFFMKFRESRLVKGAMSGLKPAVIGLIGAAAVSIALTVFFPAEWTLSSLATPSFYSTLFTSPDFYVSLLIFVGALLLAFKKAHPILIICLSAVIGIGTGYLFK